MRNAKNWQQGAHPQSDSGGRRTLGYAGTGICLKKVATRICHGCMENIFPSC